MGCGQNWAPEKKCVFQLNKWAVSLYRRPFASLQSSVTICDPNINNVNIFGSSVISLFPVLKALHRGQRAAITGVLLITKVPGFFYTVHGCLRLILLRQTIDTIA